MPLTQDAPTAEKRGCTITRKDADSFATNVAGRAFTDTEYALFVNPLTCAELKKQLPLSEIYHCLRTSPSHYRMLPSCGCSVVESELLEPRMCALAGQSLSGASFSQCIVDEFLSTGKDALLTRLTNPSTSTHVYPKRKYSTGLTENRTQLKLSAFARTFSRLFESPGLESSVAQSLELSCLATKLCSSEDTQECTSGSTQTMLGDAGARNFAKSSSGSALYGSYTARLTQKPLPTTK